MYSSHSSIHNLKLGCPNINGLSHDKLSDDLFKKFVNSLDLCFSLKVFKQTLAMTYITIIPFIKALIGSPKRADLWEVYM